MADKTGRQLLAAAGIIGIAVIGASAVLALSLRQVSQQIDRAGSRLEEIRVAVANAGEALGKLPTGPTLAAARGPDPNRRYTVQVDGSPAVGPASAAITLVEFSDFQCPFCQRVGPTLEQVKKEYGERVRIVFKHLPLDIHAKAPAAHAAAEAAHRQGKFWEMHDQIFANQAEMTPEKYVEWAAKVGLDVEKFKRDVGSPEVKERIAADKSEAGRLGATGTPAFFINGRYVSGAKPFEAFKTIIDEELAGRPS